MMKNNCDNSSIHRGIERTGHLVGISILLSIFIFITTCCAVIISGLFIWALIHFHILNGTAPSAVNLLILLAVMSMIMSFLISRVLNRIPMRPIEKIIDAINKLADGDYETRLHQDRPFELQRLSDSFNTLASELEHTTILRNDFINNFSHEFKTPVVSIKGFAKLLKDPDLEPEKREEYIDIIIHESDRLATLSSKVLDLSKVEGQSELTHLSTFNLAEQIRLSFLLLESKWSDKNIDFDIDLDELKITANEEMLLQVWINLIDNAIKFTGENGFVGLSLHQNEDWIVFRISDNGIGMSKETIEHIYNKFYQADSSRKQEGNGLGMALVKNIVNLHRGEIQIDSEEGKGTTITVLLPYYR